MPRVVEEQRALAADRLELVAVGERRAAVEHREHVAGKAKDPVNTQSVLDGPYHASPNTRSASPPSSREPLTL